jgi:hypothetical protein
MNKLILALLQKRLFSLLLVLLSLLISDTYAQDCTNYIFSNASGSYSTILGTTIHGSAVDDAGASITLPFSFNYCGTAYAYLTVSSNGYAYLANSITTTSTMSNSLNSSSYQNVLAPFWDDLKTGTSGNVVWTTTGTSPNRVITIQWSNLQWYYSNTTNFVNFQLKLYETTNAIEFIYGSMGAYPGTSASVSIGINDYIGSSTHFQSITPTSSDARASTFTEKNSINTTIGLSSGTTFRFVPPMMYVPKSNANVYYACSGTLYDNGGLSLNYDNNEDGLAIIYPSDFSKLVQLSGSIVSEGGYDFVTIYDGAGTSGTILFGGSAHSTGISCVSTSIPLLTSNVGPLTVKFHSDGSLCGIDRECWLFHTFARYSCL